MYLFLIKVKTSNNTNNTNNTNKGNQGNMKPRPQTNVGGRKPVKKI